MIFLLNFSLQLQKGVYFALRHVPNSSFVTFVQYYKLQYHVRFSSTPFKVADRDVTKQFSVENGYYVVENDTNSRSQYMRKSFGPLEKQGN